MQEQSDLQDMLWTMELPQAHISRTCEHAARILRQADPFCLWLRGEVGAGKTSWVAEFLWHLGLSRQLAVASPTFTYARAYEISGDVYNHCDLYRVTDLTRWRALGIELCDYRGMLLEWATTANCDVPPTHCLHIEFCADPTARRYVFSRGGVSS